MEFRNVFKYCPKCSAPLHADAVRLFTCTKCDFYYHINPVPCNALIAENGRGEILLVKRKFDPKKGYWDLPGGFIDFNESVEESVMREVREELGIKLDTIFYFASYPDRYLYKGVNYYTLGLVFIGRIKDQQLKAQDDVSLYKFFPKDKISFDKIAFESVKKAVKKYISR